MKKNGFIGFFTLSLCLLSLSLASCGGKKDANGWYTNFDDAKKAAMAKNKSIVLFVNSIYDDESTADGVKLLTQTNEFTRAVSEDFVCLHFDFTTIPEIMGKSMEGLTGKEQKELEKKQRALKEQFAYADMYAVRDTPACVILSKEGFYITQVNFDYLDTSISGYKSCLYLEIGTVEDFDALLKKARKGSVTERMAAYDELYGSVEEMVQPAMIALWKEAVKADKNNVTGSVGKFIMTSASVDAYEKISERKFEDGANVYQKYAEDSRLSADEKQTLLFYAAQVLLTSGSTQYDKIALILQSAIDASPESQYAETLKSYLSEMADDKSAEDKSRENEK